MWGRGCAYIRQETLPSRSPKQAESFFQRKDAIAASEVDHGRSVAQCPLSATTQSSNGHSSQLLTRAQAIDLRGVESQTRQGDAAACCSQIASPVLFFQAPALFEFA